VLSDRVVQMTAFKPADDSDDLIIRLHEPTGRRRSTTLSIPFAHAATDLMFDRYEIKTLRFTPATRRFREVDLLEHALH
jgi:alpha-mannosidase